MLDKVLLIQRNFRRYRLGCCIKSCAAEYRRLMTIKKKREDRVKQDYISSYRKSGNFPRTKKDFDMLFAQIATWKEGEVKLNQFWWTGNLKIYFYRLEESLSCSRDHHASLKSKLCSKKRFNCWMELKCVVWRFKKKCMKLVTTESCRKRVKLSNGSDIKVRQP